MKKSNSVSIIIPTFNQGSIIERAIESCLSQTYPYIEVVIADDCSTDNTKHVLMKYKNNELVRYHRNSQNLGRVKNYQYALEYLATSEWVLVLDGDDYYVDKKFIEDYIFYISKYSAYNIVFVQGGHIEVNEQKNEIIDIALPNITTDVEVLHGVYYFLNFDQLARFSHLGTMFKRTIALKIGFYKHEVISSDVESFLRMALHGDVILVKRAVGVWAKHGQNVSSTANVIEYHKNLIVVNSCMQYAKELGVPITILRDWYRRMFLEYYLPIIRLIKQYTKQKKCKELIMVVPILIRYMFKLMTNKYFWKRIFI